MKDLPKTFQKSTIFTKIYAKFSKYRAISLLLNLELILEKKLKCAPCFITFLTSNKLHLNKPKSREHRLKLTT